MNAKNLSTEEADRHESNRQHRASRRYKGEQPIRELHVNRDGRIHTVGDENTPDFDRVALENMRAAIDVDADIQTSLRRREITFDLASGPNSTTLLALDADEWEEVEGSYESWMVPTRQYEAESDALLRDIAKDADSEEDESDELDIFAIARAERSARRRMAIKSLENHALVTDFGFTAEDLVTNVDGRHPVAMGFETLAMVMAACNAADELARISHDREVVKVLGWTEEMPESLADFGADRLARHAGALKARVKAIRSQLDAAARRKGGIRPRTSVSAPPTPAAKPPERKPMPAVPTEKPVDSDWLGRVTTAKGLAYVCTCGCGVPVLEAVAQVPPFEVMRDRQGSRVSGKDLWAHAFAPRCIHTWGHGYSLIETQKHALKVEQEAARRTTPTPAGSHRPLIGKTERERLKLQVKKGLLSQLQYDLRIGNFR